MAACAGLVFANAAWGFGAIAVGLPQSVTEDGLAIGISYGQESAEAASALAIKRCQDFKDAPLSTRNLCRTLETFTNQCVSVALDPEAGTPGWGWAIATSREDAEAGALRMCRSTAGAAREKFCEKVNLRCDKTE